MLNVAFSMIVLLHRWYDQSRNNKCIQLKYFILPYLIMRSIPIMTKYYDFTNELNMILAALLTYQ